MSYSLFQKYEVKGRESLCVLAEDRADQGVKLGDISILRQVIVFIKVGNYE